MCIVWEKSDRFIPKKNCGVGCCEEEQKVNEKGKGMEKKNKKVARWVKNTLFIHLGRFTEMQIS